jgi:putative FmdB family regulatory protein
MPIYEYVCQECGAKYEKLVRIGSTEVQLRCPNCGSPRAEKAISLFGSSSVAGGDLFQTSSTRSAAACGPVG